MEELAVARPVSSTRGRTPHPERRDRIVAAGWSALVVGVIVWGGNLELSGAKLHAPPFFGRFEAHANLSIAIPILLAALVVWRGDHLAERLPWRSLLLVTAVTGGLWGVTLALTGGWDAVAQPLRSRHDYLAVVGGIESPGAFLSTFTERIASWSVHVQGHPPGAPLLFWWLNAAGLPGAGPAALVVLAAWTSVPVAALVTAKEIASEHAARRAAPFLVVAPAAVWAITSVDSLFAAVSAWGVATFAVASRRHGRRGDAMAAVSGALWGLALFLSYGVLPLGALVIVLAAAGKRIRPLLVGGVAVMVVGSAFALAGFSWFDGFDATIARYEQGVASARPLWFFSVSNLAAFAVAIGPAAVVALGRWRPNGLHLVVGATVAGVVVANLSGLSKGEVERIWLPFVPWVVLGTAWLLGRSRRGWLVAQAGVAVVVETMVSTPW